MKKEKASLIEKVMETETYKVAKEILEKFGMEHPASRTTMVRSFLLLAFCLTLFFTLSFVLFILCRSASSLMSRIGLMGLSFKICLSVHIIVQYGLVNRNS